MNKKTDITDSTETEVTDIPNLSSTYILDASIAERQSDDYDFGEAVKCTY
jgi:hypothetical protein